MHYKSQTILLSRRNVENGGSLSIINCIDGNWFKMDEVIFEEFKGTGNMELQLDRKLLTNVSSRNRFDIIKYKA
jgi:transcription termination factor Rho